MQIPSNFRLDDGISGDYDKVAEDLRELAVSPTRTIHTCLVLQSA